MLLRHPKNTFPTGLTLCRYLDLKRPIKPIDSFSEQRLRWVNNPEKTTDSALFRPIKTMATDSCNLAALVHGEQLIWRGLSV